jgi:hypothetical protein
MFASPVARDLWLKRRAGRLRPYGGLSPFYTVIDEEFGEAGTRHHCAQPGPVDDSEGVTPRPMSEERS